MSERRDSSRKSWFARAWPYIVAIISLVAALITIIVGGFPVLAYCLFAGAGVVLAGPYLWHGLVHAVRFLGGSTHLRWYATRDSATLDMQREMLTHRNLVFLGISHRMLASYFRQVIDMAGDGYLPWRSIEVFFASEEVGEAWEDKGFHGNLLESRQKIASILAGRDNIPRLRELVFRQCTRPLGYGGCMLDAFEDGAASAKRSRDIFVVNHLPTKGGDTKNSLTLRIQRRESARHCRGQAGAVWCAYRDAHGIVSGRASQLGTFTPSLWDASCQEWVGFCTSYAGMSQSMGWLLKLADLKGNERVLDVAAGTGHVSRAILDKLPDGHLTVLEGSAGMLEVCKGTLGKGERVRYALCQVPSTPESEVDIRGERFEVIFCHLSLSVFIQEPSSLSGFVRWCARHLERGGRVIINAHNGALALPAVSGYEGWEDPLRDSFKAIATREGLRDALRLRSARKATEAEVEEAFKSSGFEVAGKRPDTSGITMYDRGKLWRTPAILDAFIDVRKVGIAAARKIVDAAVASVQHRDTMPRQVVSWVFRLRG